MNTLITSTLTLGIIMGVVILFFIWLYNSITDKMILKKINKGINEIYKKENISKEDAGKKYIETLKGGKINGKRENRAETRGSSGTESSTDIRADNTNSVGEPVSEGSSGLGEQGSIPTPVDSVNKQEHISTNQSDKSNKSGNSILSRIFRKKRG